MRNIFNFVKDNIENPPWNYNFLLNLEESEYPRYLAKLFYLKTGEKLPLLKKWSFKNSECSYRINKKKLTKFNQKIQYIKLHGITDLMRNCTDKVKVRDYVRDCIGKEYLKPVLEESGVRSNNLNFSLSTLNTPLFDKIDFEKLPDSFVIKCNHGCKWHYIVKDKNKFLKNKQLVNITKRHITGWLEQDYSLWGGFELNYRGIKPKILVEPFLREKITQDCPKIQVYCFNSKPKIIINFFDENNMSIWNEKFIPIDNFFNFSEKNIKININDYINQSVDLSIKLAKQFNFVRVDWMLYKNKLYFEELTFTPYSGMVEFKDKNYDLILGNYIDLGEKK